MNKDPVCGMEIKDISNAEKTEYEGKTYYFCTTLCKIQFEQEPEKFVTKDDGDENNHLHH
jgi:YHS domain-containing protein